ncbi:MAG: bifunctional metallophosphatase/5'-nucleotidase [Chloroflexi bacterium]|nr:bifunctional metallophosphatase/5'-nucleotidase [Chloroflexota bacterium]
MNDSHAYFDLHPELFWQGGGATYKRVGGYARIATLLQQIRRERAGRVLALDCGDTLHGTYPAVQSHGRALIPILNELALDTMTAHWEFAYGPAGFRELAHELDYPVLASNCYEQDTDALLFPPYSVREIGDVRVGIIGIAATIIDKTMPPFFSEGIYLTLGKRELPGYIRRLREQERVDIVIVLSHLGFPQDAQLAHDVPGIDVLLSGHTHHRLYRPALVNGALIIQSGSQASFVGRLDLTLEDGRVTDYQHALITLDESIPPDPRVEELVRAALAPHREYLAQVVGTTEMPLDRYGILEATMDNLLLQSLLELTGAQVAFSNGWRYGAPILPGPITVNDLWNIIPVNPPVSLCQLTGQEIWDMLEENLEHTFSRDPYQQMGGYVKRGLGLRLYIKIENPPGLRIQELYVGDERVEPDRLYEVAYVTSQGVPAKYGSRRRELDVHGVEALSRYIARHKQVSAPLRGTVVAI